MPLTSEDWIENKGQEVAEGFYMLRDVDGFTRVAREMPDELEGGLIRLNQRTISHFIRLDPPPLPRWKPKGDDVYWYFEACGLLTKTGWYDWPIDKNRYAVGNCFPSKEAAEASEHYEFAQRMKAKYGGKDQIESVGRNLASCELENTRLRKENYDLNFQIEHLHSVEISYEDAEKEIVRLREENARLKEQREREGWQRVSQQIDDELLTVENLRLRELNDELVGALEDCSMVLLNLGYHATYGKAKAALAKAKGDSHE